VPLEKGTSRETQSRNIAEMMDSGHPQAQAVAASLRQARKSRRKGGDSPMARKGRHGRKGHRKGR
jgi:hypothetical protein